MTEVSKSLAILESAIGDMGYCSFWAEQLPEIFMLEFSRVLLWNPPEAEGQPPSNKIGLQFFKPKSVNFLTFSEEKTVPENWPDLMAKDELELPGGVEITFNHQEEIEKVIKSADCINYFGTDCSDIEEFFSTKFQCLVNIGDIGFLISGDDIAYRNMTEKLTLDDVEARSQQWWDYWRYYYEMKDAGTPLPKDFACEVTIPLKP